MQKTLGSPYSGKFLISLATSDHPSFQLTLTQRLAALPRATYLEGMAPIYFPPPKSPANSLRTTADSKKQITKALLRTQGLVELK